MNEPWNWSDLFNSYFGDLPNFRFAVLPKPNQKFVKKRFQQKKWRFFFWKSLQTFIKMLGGESSKRAFKKETTFGRNANTEVADILKHKKYSAKKVESFEVVREAYVDAYR